MFVTGCVKIENMSVSTNCCSLKGIKHRITPRFIPARDVRNAVGVDGSEVPELVEVNASRVDGGSQVIHGGSSTTILSVNK